MGDTYFIDKLKCAHCGEKNNFDDNDKFSLYPGIAYTYEFGADFVCKFCEKKNKVIMNFEAVKTKKDKNKK